MPLPAAGKKTARHFGRAGAHTQSTRQLSERELAADKSIQNEPRRPTI